MNHLRLQHNRELLAGKIVVGIDPSKDKHQAAVVDCHGSQMGGSFSFPVSSTGYGETLWRGLSKILKSWEPACLVFAIETACNLWETLAFFLYNRGYTVLLVSPLSTHHARPILSMEFSRTDPKDAYLVATVAQRGAFQPYEHFPAEQSAMHQMAITYDKLRKDLAQNRARVHALLDRLFPEFPRILLPQRDTAVHLLKKYLFPDEFLAMDIRSEAALISRISRRQCGRATLEELQKAAATSIGVTRRSDERLADRKSLDAFLALIETAEQQLSGLLRELVVRAEQLPPYERLRSLSGVGKRLAALFLAEVQDLSRFTHYKHLEKLAGLNLRLFDSGRYSGTRHISSIGNSRLRWILYKMAEETSKRVPEVRVKYLRRQLKRRKHVKNVVASIPQLLQLIMAMEKHQSPYRTRPEVLPELKELEEKYRQLKAQRKTAA
ncbi:MAG: IS110 family transposase [Bacteroidota bacterium]